MWPVLLIMALLLTDYEYKGYAEMVKITNDNSSDTAWVVAVLVEQHAVSNT